MTPHHLADVVAANRRQFLDTEISVGHTMLDAATSTRDPAAHARRVARAREAHDEVSRHLASDTAPALPAAERGALAAELARLQTRLTEVEAAGPPE